ncbi:hypothetical protein AB0H76_05360 [Nocardia sp. NPDC050712]|uniref:hypothetical protein n=1 Tax=Nocardia sp. NPDC050712 TaxID=3155518 RepID=UPI003402B1D6
MTPVNKGPVSGGLSFVVGGALGLAAHYFPRRTDDGKTYVRLDDALYFLSGHVEVWSRWHSLEQAERSRIARLLRFREVEVANRNVFARLVNELIPGQIPGFRMGADDQLLVDLGCAPLEYVDECLGFLLHEREVRPRAVRAVARSGLFATPLNLGQRDGGSRTVDVRYRLELTEKEAVREVPTIIGGAADAASVTIPISDLRDLAVQLDTAFGQIHRLESVNRIFDHLGTQPGEEVEDGWALRAGPTQILHAPTGVGKNVVAELVACWCVENNMVASLVVPTNAVVAKTAYSIERSLRALGHDNAVVALTSPRSAQKLAEETARNAGTDPLGEWTFTNLAYGCAMPSAALTDSAVDSWQPGQEPCDGLRKVGEDGRAGGSRAVCPWKRSCGKFRNVRAALTASVVVTSHPNWHVGVVQVPTEIDGRIDENLRVEELLLRRSHIVLIDEIDAFQAAMIGRSARDLVLADRRSGARPSPLRRLDNELADSSGRVDASVEHEVRAATAQARFLAETYTGHLAEGAFRRAQRGRNPGHPLFGRWLLPRRWDARLVATLFGIPEGVAPLPAHYAMLQGLFPGEGDPTTVPDWLLPIREALHRVTSLTTGNDEFQPAWATIAQTLADCPDPHSQLKEVDERAVVTDRLVRRAYLEQLRSMLFRFVYAAPQLQASGITAARDVAEALGPYAEWRATPYGPLGRSLFAFTEKYDPDRPDETSLRVSGFGGDPHNYVTSIGDLTALAHFGKPRVVVGLSATSYFPGAPHHHVFTKPTWWVSDDHSGGVRILSSPVFDGEDFLRVSGTNGEARSEVLVRLGEILWKKRLAPALRDLAADPKALHRQRLLLAVTSYEGVRDLADGISNAGVPADKIVAAVRPGDEGSNRRWTPLPADQLESFGTKVDGSVLIAPLGRAERGLNIVDSEGRSLLGSVWLVVRPVPIIDEPAQILAHVHSRATAAVRATTDPVGVLEIVRRVAGQSFDEMFNSLPYFSTMPTEIKLGIVAENLNGLIQLAGRARRGGTTGEIHLVDYAFIDSRGQSDMPRLITKLRTEWQREGHFDLMQRLYGDTLTEILDFAEQREIASESE